MACKLSSSPTTRDDQSSFSLVSLCSAASSSSNPTNDQIRDHAENLLKRMKTYLETFQLCDVTLISALDGKKITAHRLVLAAASSYFDAMFTGSLREANETEIRIQEVPGDTLQILVNYCYTGTLEIREDNVETLLATSCLLQLNSVVTSCCNFLVKQLHPSNCLGFALFAEQQSCDKLLTLANSYTSMNFMQVWKNQEFYQLDKIQLGNLLKSDDLNVPSEAEVFHALMAWVQHDAEARKKYISELLALVRLPLLQPAFIADYVETLCSDDAECQQLVMEAMKWHLLPERRSQITTQRTRPRKSTIGKLLTIGGMDMHKGAISIENYDPRSDKWTLLKNMSTKRLQFGVVVMDDKLILVGGRDGLKTLNTVESVDLPTMMTSSMSQMSTPRHGLGVAVLEGPLYAVGGHDGWSYLNTVERWDPVGRSWAYVCPMTVSRSTAGVAVLGNRLYVCGGRDGSNCHRSVESYDPHTNKWTLRAQMNRRRGGVGVAVLNGFLYALGGHDSLSHSPTVCRTETVERYCPQTDAWTMIASLSVGRDSIGVCTLGDRLAAVGGYDGNQYLKIFEEYDPEKNEWTERCSVNFSRAGACVLNLPTIFLPSNSATV